METVNQVLKAKTDDTSAIASNTEKESLKDVSLNETDITNDSTDKEPNNCLALTVKEEYRVVVFKNIIKKGLKISWKIAISIITMNFLNTFL